MVERINDIIKGASAFAMYRLPFADECHIIAMESGHPHIFNDISELEGRSGFVMIPFHIGGGHPIVLLPYGTEHCIQLKDMQGTDKEPDTMHAGGLSTGSPSGHSPVAADCGKESYLSAFGKFHDRLCSGQFEKLVLSRKEERYIGSTDMTKVFLRACATYPRMMVYLCSIPGCGIWTGCTPEIFLAGSKSHYRTVALAGTMAAAKDGAPHDTICWSEKNRKEQKIVADYIRERLRPFAHVIEEEGPYTSRAGQLLHLKTEFHFTPAWSRKSGSTSPCAASSVFSERTCHDTVRMSDLIRCLHPTPAVCGLPQTEAMRFICENEGYDRSYYAGIVGMLCPDGDTNLYVNLRCASVSPNGTATFYAGGGLLPSSTACHEWEETEAKLKTISNVFR